MTRVTNSVASRRKRGRLFKRAKGFVGDRKNHLRLTKNAVMSAMAFNYNHRKQKKRDFRSLWITRLNVAARIHGMPYHRFIYGLKKAQCTLDRKTLSDMAIQDPSAFAAVVEKVKQAFLQA